VETIIGPEKKIKERFSSVNLKTVILESGMSDYRFKEVDLPISNTKKKCDIYYSILIELVILCHR